MKVILSEQSIIDINAMGQQTTREGKKKNHTTHLRRYASVNLTVTFVDVSKIICQPSTDPSSKAHAMHFL